MAAAPVLQTHAQAPRRELVGVVRDPAGSPVEGATVEIRGAAARTNGKGAFQLFTPDVDTVTISIRRLGYSAVSALLTARSRQWDTVLVEMEATSQFLTGVKVNEARTRAGLGLRDFEERRALGNGLFVTREEIAARSTSKLSDVLQSKRGIRLVRLGNNRYGVRFASYAGSKGMACAPDVWLDGQRARGMEVDDLLANDIEAMELYESFATLPAQFTPFTSSVPCGTIVVWSRIPNGKSP
jgi:hypothetical protein